MILISEFEPYFKIKINMILNIEYKYIGLFIITSILKVIIIQNVKGQRPNDFTNRWSKFSSDSTK